MFLGPVLRDGVFPGAVFGGYFALADEETDLVASAEASAEGLVVASLFAELECLCADGSWEWPTSPQVPAGR